MEQKTESQKDKPKKNNYEGKIVRILSQDIEGGMNVFSGLTKIKGISWSFANAVCKTLGFDRSKKIGSLTEKEIKKITEFVENPDVLPFILNRRFEFESGEDKHVTGADLDLKKEFDIKRLKKIKSYRGIRHGAGLPVRGQRTKSNFRKERKKGSGIKKKSKKREQ